MIKKFLLAFIAALLFLTGNCSAALKVVMLDVAQGDSFLIQTDSENILIDTGDTYGRGKLFQQLQLFNVERIDRLILTHPHADHIANAAALIDNLTVAQVYDNGAASSSIYYRNYLAACRNKNIARSTLREGDYFFLDDGAYLQILSANRFADNANNNAVICKLVYEDFTM